MIPVLPIFQAIAAFDRPILFHSVDILWDGKPSSQYNRPLAFGVCSRCKDCVLRSLILPGPGVTNYRAVWQIFKRPGLIPELAVEMFIDLTPGTPPIYRRQA